MSSTLCESFCQAVLRCEDVCVFSVPFCYMVVVLFCDGINLLKWLMWRSNRFASYSASNSARWLQKHRLLTEAFGDKALGQTQTYNGLSISRTGGYQSMMKSVLDDLQPEPRLKMWQKFDTEGIVHKEFVPPGQTVNGTSIVKFWGEWDQNIQTSDATTLGPSIMTMLRLMCRSLWSGF